MVLNGRIPKTQLTSVFPSALMLNSVAVSVKTMVHVAKLEGVLVTAAGKFQSGYRDLAGQQVFWDAAHGSRSAAAKAGIDPAMRVAMGAVGYQSHGFGDRIDLLFNGMSPKPEHLALVRRYGGIQEFGDDDHNHFRFDKSVTGVAESDKNRIVCHYLNRQHLGVISTTEDDGEWPAESHFSEMLQIYGSHQKGWYPQPQFKIDGIAGDRTKWVRNKLWAILWG